MDIFSAQEFCFLQAPGQKKTEVPSGASVFSAEFSVFSEIFLGLIFHHKRRFENANADDVPLVW